MPETCYKVSNILENKILLSTVLAQYSSSFLRFTIVKDAFIYSGLRWFLSGIIPVETLYFNQILQTVSYLSQTSFDYIAYKL